MQPNYLCHTISTLSYELFEYFVYVSGYRGQKDGGCYKRVSPSTNSTEYSSAFQIQWLGAGLNELSLGRRAGWFRAGVG
jgi:hypothetical protein